MLEALVAPSACLCVNYERLEFLGDAYLNFVSYLYVYLKIVLIEGGDFGGKYSDLICNNSLSIIAENSGTTGYIVTETLVKSGPTVLSYLRTKKSGGTPSIQKQFMGPKLVADVIEAILGACVLNLGGEEALNTALSLGIPFVGIQKWSDFSELSTFKIQIPKEEYENALELSANMNDILGYRFNSFELFLQTLWRCASLQCWTDRQMKVKALGKFTYSFFLRKYLFLQCPNASPGDLTALAARCENACTLAFIYVNLKLYNYSIMYSESTKAAIAEYIVKVKKAAGNSGFYWLDITPPKGMANALMMIFGCILIDSKFSLSVAENFFDTVLHGFSNQYLE